MKIKMSYSLQGCQSKQAPCDTSLPPSCGSEINVWDYFLVPSNSTVKQMYLSYIEVFSLKVVVTLTSNFLGKRKKKRNEWGFHTTLSEIGDFRND